MTPARPPRDTKGTETRKPGGTASVNKRNVHKHVYPQRSSLRRAIRMSLRDSSAVTAPAAIATPPSSPSSPRLSLSLSGAPTVVSRRNIPALRSSLRRALKESRRDLSALSAVVASSSPLSSALSSTSPEVTSTRDATLSAPPSLITSTKPTTRATDSSSIPPPITVSTTPPPGTTLVSAVAYPLRRSIRKYPPGQQQQQQQQQRGQGWRNPDSRDAKSDERDRDENICEEDESSKEVDKADINGIPTSRKGWYCVRSIITEARDQNGRLMYFVEWEGRDPRTGISWPGSWDMAIGKANA